MKNGIIHLAIISVLFRLVFLLYNGTQLNPDDQVLWQVAGNHLAGNGYTINGEQTAFHSQSMMLIYEGLQMIGMPQPVWAWLVIIASLALFIISVRHFYRLCYDYLPDKWAYGCTVLYIFYPSVIFYVGGLNLYENIVVSLLIIGIDKLKGGFSWQVILFAIISAFMKPSSLFIWLTVLLLSPRWVVCWLFVLAAHIPALIKNHNQFGHYFLSTQMGYELLQGHNELARGSWYGNWNNPSTEYYKYVSQHISQQLNEYEQSQQRSRMAVKWALNNPLKEVWLTVRKVVIYFIPNNLEVLYGYWFWNPVTLLVHLGFLIFLFIKVNDKRFLMVVPACCLALNIIFFVVLRVRFFAEPFMIIGSVLALHHICEIKFADNNSDICPELFLI